MSKWRCTWLMDRLFEFLVTSKWCVLEDGKSANSNLHINRDKSMYMQMYMWYALLTTGNLDVSAQFYTLFVTIKHGWVPVHLFKIDISGRPCMCPAIWFLVSMAASVLCATRRVGQALRNLQQFWNPNIAWFINRKGVHCMCVMTEFSCIITRFLRQWTNLLCILCWWT